MLRYSDICLMVLFFFFFKQKTAYEMPSLVGSEMCIRDSLKVEPEDLVLDYYGLNHCGFVKGVYALGHDVLPQILSMIDQVPGFEAMTHFSPAFVQHLGKLPNGYIWYYAFKRESLAAMKAAGETRGEEVERLNAQLVVDLMATGDPLAAYQAYLGKREDGHLAEEYRTAMHLSLIHISEP